MTTNQNLPCPFCGHPPEFREWDTGDYRHTENDYQIQCTGPDNHSLNHIASKEELLKIWNTRPPHPLEEKVRELSTEIINLNYKLIDKSKAFDEMKENVREFREWLENPDNHGFMTWSASLSIREKYIKIFGDKE